jgi:hypothetical protein
MDNVLPVIRRLVALHILGERLGQTRDELSHRFNRDDIGNRAMFLLLQDVRDWLYRETAYEWRSVEKLTPKNQKPTRSRRKRDNASHPAFRRYTDE